MGAVVLRSRYIVEITKTNKPTKTKAKQTQKTLPLHRLRVSLLAKGKCAIFHSHPGKNQLYTSDKTAYF